MRADLAIVAKQATAKLRMRRLLEFEVLGRGLEVERKHFDETSFATEKVKADQQRRREELEATRCQADELKQTLAIVWAREVELSQTIEATPAKISSLDEEAQLASALVLSLEEEQRRKAIPSEEEVRAESHGCQDVTVRMKALEDQIKKVGGL